MVSEEDTMLRVVVVSSMRKTRHMRTGNSGEGPDFVGGRVSWCITIML